MNNHSAMDELISALSRLPSLGRRSAQRIALHMLSKRDDIMFPLADALVVAANTIKPCTICGYLDAQCPCKICADGSKNRDQICIVAGACDVWALEGSGAYHGLYHVTGGVLSAMDGITPNDLFLDTLVNRANSAKEVILALPSTVDGHTTAHYIVDMLRGSDVKITRLAQGMPVGGELDYMDAGTISTALHARRGNT